MQILMKLWKLVYLSMIISIYTGCISSDSFTSDWPQAVKRVWIGPEYWANPLQDWQLNDGRIECIASGGDRNVVLLTHEIKKGNGEFKMSVAMGPLESVMHTDEEGWIGFKIGIRGEFSDYRDSAVRGQGFPVGITTGGRLFIGQVDSTLTPVDLKMISGRLELQGVVENETANLKLLLFDEHDQLLSEIQRAAIHTDWIVGLVGVVSSHGQVPQVINGRRPIDYPTWGTAPGTARGGNIHFWFKDWILSGNLVHHHPDRSFGPILFSQYTLSKGTLRLTAQMPPVGEQDGQKVILQTKENDKWHNVSKSTIDALSRTAIFSVQKWDTTQNIPYRLVYEMAIGDRKTKKFYREGVIRKEPWEKENIVVAGFTGNNDLGFPNNELVNAVKFHDPDVLFFSGDQIYEGVGGYGIQTKPVEKAVIDYLRKWYLYGWAYGDLMRDRPTVAIPDDHDVYHGNVWGAGGIAAPKGTWGYEAQDAGGYKLPPEWVNMVQRTQTSHLPDPYDPEPVAQNIDVYYCDMTYAGISFAIIEDRKFKSAPKLLLPKAKVQNGWAQNHNFNAANEGDVPGAVLLGKRQLKFLNDWSSDWTNKTWMKVVLSQTIFANVATLPVEKSHHDQVVPSLKIFKTGEYPPDDVPVSDMDSNGWPQTGRNEALRAMRKGFAFHLAGDQHLGSTIQYGVDDWYDAGYAFCVPAISNVWPRRWFPKIPGTNQVDPSKRYTGDHKDGFGNKITVHAVSNPFYSGKKPAKLYDRATGYGIVKFNRKSREITIECWPRWIDPSQKGASQYPDWPVIINQKDNYNRKAIAWLPLLKVNGISNPVVQVINEAKNEVVYTIRITGDSFRPDVFVAGKYTINIGEPDTEHWQSFSDIKSMPVDDQSIIDVRF